MTDEKNEEKKKDPNPSVVPPIASQKPPESSRDPLMLIVEIVENKNISPHDKTSLIEYARRRFRNRTRIAYIALFSHRCFFSSSVYSGLHRWYCLHLVG